MRMSQEDVVFSNAGLDLDWRPGTTRRKSRRSHFRGSGEVALAKPNAAIFGVVLEQLSVSPGCVWHVGDSLSADVGANAAGLKAVWLNRDGRVRSGPDLEPEIEIGNLTQLFDLLK